MHGLAWWQFGRSIAHGLLALLLNPLYYLGCVLIVWERLRAARNERRFFGARATRVWRPAVAAWLQSLIAGLLASAACLAAGVQTTPILVAALTAVTILLGIIRLRLLSPVYAIAVLLVAALLIQNLHVHAAPGIVGTVVSQMAHLNLSSWLALAAALYLAEAVLLWCNRRRPQAPAYVQGKRGRPVGAFLLQWSYIIPVLTFAPGSLPTPHLMLPGWPFLGALPGDVTLLALPLIVGWSGFSITTRTPERALTAARHSLVAGLVLAADAYVAHRWGWAYACIGVVVCAGAREWTVWRMRQRESQGEPMYAQVPDGVRVLSTSRGSLAESMGLRPGEIITQVNQVPVHSAYDLHFAFEQNPAYAKLHVQDDRGELRIVGKPVYSGERNQLGLVLAPDDVTITTYHKIGYGLFQVAYAQLANRDPLPGWTDFDSAPSTEI